MQIAWSRRLCAALSGDMRTGIQKAGLLYLPEPVWGRLKIPPGLRHRQHCCAKNTAPTAGKTRLRELVNRLEMCIYDMQLRIYK